MMENPPKLPDDVLQKLLSEAHFPLYGRLSAVREEDESNGKASLHHTGYDRVLSGNILIDEQKLLAEAHFPLYGRLSAVREEDESNGKAYMYHTRADRSLYRNLCKRPTTHPAVLYSL